MQLPVKSPLAVAAGLAVIAAGAGAVLWWLFGSSQEVLYDHLESAQLNSVAAELDRAGIHYTVDRKDSSVLVSSHDAQQARSAVQASGNLHREAAGFELFDKSDFGMTEFSQRINYQRAIEGEIARTVSALADVKYTRVHLVLPEHSLFQNEQRKPRASVTVFLNQNATLSDEHIKGIQRIAASAVPDLDEQSVTVVNQNGVVLSDSSDQGGGGRATAQGRLLQKKSIEDYLDAKIRQVLIPAVGAGNFAVSVDVSLDLTQKTTTTEKVLGADNNGGVKRLKESSNRGKGENGSDDLLREVEYAVGRQSEQVVHSGGEIKRLQVGVVIDSAVPDVDIAKLRELIAATAGLDNARGDHVAVVQRHLPRAPANAEATVLPSPVAAAAPPVSASFNFWTLLSLVLGGVAGASAVFIATRRGPRRVDEQALQHLQQRLQAWVDAETTAVEKP